MREWWVGDRKDNRDRKFGGRERGGREDAWGAGGGRDRGERGRRERGGRDDAWGGAGDGRARGEGGGRERGGRGGDADWGDRRDAGGSWGARERMGRSESRGAWAGGNRGDKVPFSQAFKRAEGDAAEVDARAVEGLIREREDARKSRDYKTADGLRDELVRNFGVNVDDGEREWWVGERKGNRVRKFNEMRGDAPPPGTWGANREDRGDRGDRGGGRGGSWGQFRGGGYERDRRGSSGRGRGGGGGGWGGGSGSGGYRSRDGGGRDDISAEDLGWG